LQRTGGGSTLFEPLQISEARPRRWTENQLSAKGGFSRHAKYISPLEASP
jgi:hypothetical protein